MKPKRFRDHTALGQDEAGFIINDGDIGNTEDLALLSLRRALQAYCATYAAMMDRLRVFDPGQNVSRADVAHAHGLEYVEMAFATLLHFQHFAEIVVKRVLSDVHPLLPVSETGARHHELVFDLLTKGAAGSAERVESLRWMEFREALERVVALVSAGKLDSKLSVFRDYRDSLLLTNTLRNRLLHRGRFILRYDALDELVVGSLLPFSLRAAKLKPYRLSGYWRPKPLACKLDPLAALEDSKGTYDLKRVAFFKAMTAAAYANPLNYALPDERRRLASVSEHSVWVDEPGVHQVRRCPVCGVQSLVLYETQDDDRDDDGETISWWWSVYRIDCRCCGLKMNDIVGNPRDYGVDVDDFWIGENH